MQYRPDHLLVIFPQMKMTPKYAMKVAHLVPVINMVIREERHLAKNKLAKRKWTEKKTIQTSNFEEMDPSSSFGTLSGYNGSTRHLLLSREEAEHLANSNRRLLAPPDKIRNRNRQPKKNQTIQDMIQCLREKQLEIVNLQIGVNKILLQNAKITQQEFKPYACR